MLNRVTFCCFQRYTPKYITTAYGRIYPMETTGGNENTNLGEEKKEITLTFRDKYGFPFTRTATDVDWATSKGRHCNLTFENGEKLEWNKSLKQFRQLVYHTNLYRKLGRFLVIKIGLVRSRKFRLALLKSGKDMPLTRGGNRRLKTYITKHPHRKS